MDILKRLFLIFFEERQWLKLVDMVHDLFAGNIYNQIAVVSLIISFLVFTASFFATKRKKDIFRILSMLFYIFFIINAMVLGRPSGERVFTLWTIDMFYTGKVFHETSIIMAFLKLMIFVPLGFYIFAKIYRRGNGKNCFAIICIWAIPILIETLKYILAKGVPSLGGILVHIVGELIGFFIGCCVLHRGNLAVNKKLG